jgi:hypothetical protein
MNTFPPRGEHQREVSLRSLDDDERLLADTLRHAFIGWDPRRILSVHCSRRGEFFRAWRSRSLDPLDLATFVGRPLVGRPRGDQRTRRHRPTEPALSAPEYAEGASS